MEWNDIYDENGRPTGRVHQRGTPWKPGEYGLVVCVWVLNGRGQVLLTRRAPEKSYPGTWENSGGSAQAGETPRQAIARELFEETGIRADPESFHALGTERSGSSLFAHFWLCRELPASEVVLQPGETTAAQWADFDQVEQMIHRGQICEVIGRQFHRWRTTLEDCAE